MEARQDRLAIVAVTARALAQAARRSSAYRHARIVALDWFADRDLAAAADQVEALPTRRAGGFAERPLFAALRRLVPEGSLVVLGSGFESRLALQARLAADYRVAGNPAAVLARVKDPRQFFPALTRLGIPHPEVAREVPRGEVSSWLIKRVGGAGGGHIRPARRGCTVPVSCYAQRRVPGSPVSLAFLADGGRAEPLGFTEQWPSPARRTLYRFGGAAFPALLARELAERMVDWVGRLAREFALRGLNSADFLVEDEYAWCLEINPRPGATLDLLDRARPGLFEAHVEACFDRLSLPRMTPGPARAARILYADRGAIPVGTGNWPAWVADRPHAGATISAGGPICTVFGEGRDVGAARRSAEDRAAAILERLDAAAYAEA